MVDLLYVNCRTDFCKLDIVRSSPTRHHGVMLESCSVFVGPWNAPHPPLPSLFVDGLVRVLIVGSMQHEV